MSTETMLVHVPVDEIEILRGSLTIGQLFYFMGDTKKNKSIEMKVTLRTAASKRPFNRSITITQVPTIDARRRRENRAFIVGTFAGNKIEGDYAPNSRKKGSIHLASAD